MNRKSTMALVLGTIILGAVIVGAIILITQNNEEENEIESTQDTQNTQNNEEPANETPESTKKSSEQVFKCKVNGEEIDYTQNINIDTPIPTETRVSGIASNGSNIKLILRTTSRGNYTTSKDFGMSYQPSMSTFDYNKIYSSKMDEPGTLELLEFSDDRIVAEFAGEVYDGNNEKLILSNCLVSVESD
ncbi:hypothetical protein GF389_00920 [Candidatus Dojkabacteria bacterium]|nr:hypothetical protein [Candidatus Dojkabacteria bacterium]